MLIGQGFDVHAFGPGDHVVLAGVRIPHEQGLEAHSDGDVAIHALVDALLGAAGMGDIGGLFPDDDPVYAGIDSRVLLREVMARLQGRGLRAHNADLTLVAQRPRMAPYIGAMRAILAGDLGLAPQRVNVKATTSEGLGFTGRGEGIAALAVVLLEEDPGRPPRPGG